MTIKLICSISFMLLFWYTQNVFADFIEDRNKYFCESNDIDMEKAKKFLDRFNDLVQKSDKKAIARMVHYPLQVYKRKKSGIQTTYRIKKEKEFLKQYPLLFNETAKKILAEHHKVNCHPWGWLYTAGGNFSFYYGDEGIKIAIIDTIQN